MSNIDAIDQDSGIYDLLNQPIGTDDVDKDLDGIANEVVRLRSEAEQTGGGSAVIDLKAMDGLLRDLSIRFNALFLNEQMQYLPVLEALQEADLCNYYQKSSSGSYTLNYNGENMPQSEWEAMINSLFKICTDGSWYKGQQLHDLLVALKPYGEHFSPDQCTQEHPIPAETKHEKEMEEGLTFFNQMMHAYEEDHEFFLTKNFDGWIVNVSGALDQFTNAYNASNPSEKKSFQECAEALKSAGILDTELPEGSLSRSWSSNIEKPKMLFREGHMYHIDSISGDFYWDDRFMIMMAALAKRDPV